MRENIKRGPHCFKVKFFVIVEDNMNFDLAIELSRSTSSYTFSIASSLNEIAVPLQPTFQVVTNLRFCIVLEKGYKLFTLTQPSKSVFE